MLKQKLAPKVAMKSVMTKSMQQSINILGMKTLDLKEYIEGNLQDNPFLQFEGESEESGVASDFGVPISRVGDYSQDDFIDNMSSKALSLKEHLCRQIDISFSEGKQKNLAYQITDYIDDNGYLSLGLKELASELKVKTVFLEDVLVKLQAFDPIGVYSEDLQDCLRLQAKDQGFYSDNFAILLDNLDLLAKCDIELLEKKCGVKAAVLKVMVQQLQSLNPKPGLAYNNALAQVVVPEIIFEKDDSGELKVFLNKNDMPKVCFHQSYYMDLKNDLDAEAKLFIKENKRLAANLINALDKRSALLMRFGSEILDMQYEFFKCGQDYLKPMTIKEMANRLDVHESTISRLSNKYVQTMYGILPIKFFFSSKLANVYTEHDNSSRAVKKQICDLVTAEDVNKVLSDRQLCDILCSQYNVVISRRTVAKYREELKIAPSIMRKKQKKML